MEKTLKCFEIIISRNFSNSLGIVVSLVIMPLVIAASFYAISLSNNTEKIAVLGENKIFIQYLDNNKINYSRRRTFPTKREIYLRKYSGAIENQNGRVKIISYRGQKYRRKLQRIAEKKYVRKQSRKSKKILQAFYITMSILLIQATLNMKLFVDDRKSDISKRLQVIGVKSSQYLSAYLLFNWVVLMVPFSLFNVICSKIFFDSNIKDSLKIILISLIATGLFAIIALFICTLVSDNGSVIMIGNIIACFSALLSGMFGSFHNRMLLIVSQFMPQRIVFSWMKKVFENDYILRGDFFVILSICTVLMLASWTFYSKSEFTHR